MAISSLRKVPVLASSRTAFILTFFPFALIQTGTVLKETNSEEACAAKVAVWARWIELSPSMGKIVTTPSGERAGVPVALRIAGSSSTAGKGLVELFAAVEGFGGCRNAWRKRWWFDLQPSIPHSLKRRHDEPWKAPKAQSLILGYLPSINSVQCLEFLALPDFMAFSLAKTTDSTTFWLACMFHHS